MRNRLRVFMLGRNGIDQLVTAFIVAALVSDILFTLLGLIFLRFIPLIFLVLAMLRLLSKNVARRREENYRFTRVWADAKCSFSGWRKRTAQSGEYKFFKCPSCRTKLRVPKGKGRIKITCSKCGQRFDGKT